MDILAQAKKTVTDAGDKVVSSAKTVFDAHFNKVKADAQTDIADLSIRVNKIKTSSDKIKLSREIEMNIKHFKELKGHLDSVMKNDHNSTNESYKRISSWAENTLNKYESLLARTEAKKVAM